MDLAVLLGIADRLCPARADDGSGDPAEARGERESAVWHSPDVGEFDAYLGKTIAVHEKSGEGRLSVRVYTPREIQALGDSTAQTIRVVYSGPFAPYAFPQGEDERYEPPLNPWETRIKAREEDNLGFHDYRVGDVEVQIEPINDVDQQVAGPRNSRTVTPLRPLMEALERDGYLSEEIPVEARQRAYDAVIIKYLCEVHPPTKDGARHESWIKDWIAIVDAAITGNFPSSAESHVKTALGEAVRLSSDNLENLKHNFSTAGLMSRLAMQVITADFRRRYSREILPSEKEDILRRSIPLLMRLASLPKDVFNTIADRVFDPSRDGCLELMGRPGEEALSFKEGAEATLRRTTGVGLKLGTPKNVYTKCPALPAEALTTLLDYYAWYYGDGRSRSISKAGPRG
jgi:hypothetical protein